MADQPKLIPAPDVNADRPDLPHYAADFSHPSPAPVVGKDIPARYTHTVDQTRHTSEVVNGRHTDVQQEIKTDDNLSGEFDNRVMTVLNGALTARKAAEDKRANHRNFNRLLTLLGAVIIGLVLTYLSVHGEIPKQWAPYTFVITVLLDSTFSLYALIRHY